MTSSLKPIPDGYHTVNAYLTVQNSPAAIEFYQSVTDPFGHNWGLATHIEDLSPEDLQKRAAAAMAKMGE